MTRTHFPYGPVVVGRVQRIKEWLLEEPNRFFMEGYAKLGDSVIGCSPGSLGGTPGGWQDPPCGTAGCIAGTANILRLTDAGVDLKTLPGRGHMSWLADERAALRWITGDDTLEYDTGAWSALCETGLPNIFYQSYWPEPFQSAYKNATSPAERARAGADFLDYVCGLYDGPVWKPGETPPAPVPHEEDLP